MDVYDAFLELDAIADILTDAVVKIAHTVHGEDEHVRSLIEATAQNAETARDLANQLLEYIKQQNVYRRN